MLAKSEGASLDALVAATGWLPHSARAALTSLRKRGFAIERRARGRRRLFGLSHRRERQKRGLKHAPGKQAKGRRLGVSRPRRPPDKVGAAPIRPQKSLGSFRSRSSAQALEVGHRPSSACFPVASADGPHSELGASRSPASAISMRRRAQRSPPPCASGRDRNHFHPALPIACPNPDRFWFVNTEAFSIASWFWSAALPGTGGFFASLSSLARAITGTSWNGHRFFGLDRRREKIKGGAAKDAKGRRRSARQAPRGERFMTASTLRCAIYTRVSSDFGLEQDFNSLDAQRESAEAYIKSQAHEGWRLVRDRFDDGGFSGGSMERPALQKLLERIRERRIDVVVVYKVDRLTRSLADFAKLVELFDAHKVSFVSVTQAFNTTSSMGRLTLNVLLSFAQFEREVTGERIRDKIAASKKKGIWMGGVRSLRLPRRGPQARGGRGARPRSSGRSSISISRTARCAPSSANFGSRNIRSRERFLSTGEKMGGVFFTNGPIAYILRNRHYLGEINHKDKSWPGRARCR